MNFSLPQLATIRNTGTNRPSFSCSNVAECTEKLQKIEVTLRDGVSVQDVCKITIEVRSEVFLVVFLVKPFKLN